MSKEMRTYVVYDRLKEEPLTIHHCHGEAIEFIVDMVKHEGRNTYGDYEIIYGNPEIKGSKNE